MPQMVSKIKKIIPPSVKESMKMLNYRRQFHYQHLPNEKMVVAFLVARTNVFNSVRSIFMAAEKDENVDAYLVALPDRSKDKNNNNTDNVFAFCRDIAGDKAIDSNIASEQGFDLKTLNPEYVFLGTPYDEEYPTGFHFAEMTQYTKLCFVPYGYSCIDGVTVDTALNIHMLSYVSILFADGSVSKRYCAEKLKYICGITKQKIVSLGYPRFDLYHNEKKSGEIQNIVYLPRWSTPQNVQNGHEPSSFMLFKDKILDYAQKHPEFSITIRPHPIMFYRYVQNGLMTEKEVAAYKERIECLPNVKLDDSADYRNVLLWADVSISDFSSTMIEYSLTRKPQIFFGSGKNKPAEDKSLYTDTIQYPFCGIDFSIPRDYKKLLENRYGDYMKLPPLEKRNPTHGILRVKL